MLLVCGIASILAGPFTMVGVLNCCLQCFGSITGVGLWLITFLGRNSLELKYWSMFFGNILGRTLTSLNSFGMLVKRDNIRLIKRMECSSSPIA